MARCGGYLGFVPLQLPISTSNLLSGAPLHLGWTSCAVTSACLLRSSSYLSTFAPPESALSSLRSMSVFKLKKSATSSFSSSFFSSTAILI